MSSKEDDDLARAIEASIRDMELKTQQKLRLDGVNRHPEDSSLIEIKSLNQFHETYASRISRNVRVEISKMYLNTHTQSSHIDSNP